MKDHLTELEAKALRLAEEFTNNVLDGISPEGKCFTVCYPLSIYLDMKKCPNSIVQGNCGGISHFWIRIDEKSKDDIPTIIDPTYKQIDDNGPLVFLGKENEKGHDFITIITFKIIADQNHDIFRISNIITKAKQNNNLLEYLSIFLSSSIILHTTFKEIQNYKNQMYNDFLSQIQELIRILHKVEKNLLETLRTELPKEFEEIYKEAIKNEL